MRCRSFVTVLAAMALVPLLAAPAAGQDEAPRTPWGAPDLQGVWDFRTITPLQRPEELGDQEFLTEEEAANLEQEAVDRDIFACSIRPRGEPRPAGALAPTTTSGWIAARTSPRPGARR